MAKGNNSYVMPSQHPVTYVVTAATAMSTDGGRGSTMKGRRDYLMPLERSRHHCEIQVWYSTKKDARSSVREASLLDPKPWKLTSAI